MNARFPAIGPDYRDDAVRVGLPSGVLCMIIQVQVSIFVPCSATRHARTQEGRRVHVPTDPSSREWGDEKTAARQILVQGACGIGRKPAGQGFTPSADRLGYLFEKSEYRNTFVSGYTEEL
jgi:hypothetical protein